MPQALKPSDVFGKVSRPRTSVLHNVGSSLVQLVPSNPLLHTTPSIEHPHGSFTMSAPSLTSYIVKRPWLKNWMMPLANWYTDAAGYRRLGLK